LIVGVSRSELVRQKKELATMFYELPIDEQLQFSAREVSQCEQTDVPEDVDWYKVRIGGRLSGMSDKTAPYARSHFDEVVNGALRDHGREGFHGMRNYAGVLRERFAACMIPTESGTAPAK
jgi:hypothetical protein